ncbi:HAD family hydrolase [Nocardiopsis sp. JB363]|uniref:HAD family hydrolase n=1 Tax=Nocardiopsis sp. JB363 TaxID=1434837 RepID=UPI00097B3F6C|nr:HAD family hydrolase [Nocardiopsis sp. JB363]SIO88781.1 Phosphoglycolate phosphatase [Nocardiopsis sp. JB363]
MSARAVIFDLDGTLVDSPAAITRITSDLLREMGHELPDAEIRATVGKPLEQNLAQLMGLEPEHPDIVKAKTLYRERFGAYVRERRGDLLYPGVREGLDRLRGRGTRTAVATSKTLDGARKTVRATDIADLIEALVGDDMVATGKPDPEMALHAAGLLDTDPERCTVVGDTVGDIRMGRAAGMATIGVTYGVGEEAELLASGAGDITDSFAEVVDLLLRENP